MSTLPRLDSRQGPFYKLDCRVKNFASSLTLLTLTYLFYNAIPYYCNYFAESIQFFAVEFLVWDAFNCFYFLYVFLLMLVYLLEKEPDTSKSIYCLQGLRRLLSSPTTVFQEGFTAEERLGLLTFFLKAFFVPLMIKWLLMHTANMVANGTRLIGDLPELHTEFLTIFNTYGFWFLLQVILFLDVLFFTIGYLVELPFLKNKIRSVEPTLLGWAVALVCYPPFNYVSGYILAWQPIDFPQFNNPAIHIVMNLLFLVLMGIYTAASVALNFKASNLTHRGIVSCWPYSLIRHPAYTCKTMAWWIGAVPAMMMALDKSLWDVVLVLSSILGWTFIYILRALTEEEHLSKVDGEYDQYCAKVRYRFIPGVV